MFCDIFQPSSKRGDRKEEIPTRLVFNKTDRIEDKGLTRRLKIEYPRAIFTSAATGKGIGNILKEIEVYSKRDRVKIEVTVSLSEGKTIDLLEKVANISERVVSGESVRIIAVVKRNYLAVLEKKSRVRLLGVVEKD